MNIPFIIGLIVAALSMVYAAVLVLAMICAAVLMFYNKNKKPQNKVHFYVARDKNGVLTLWFGKPYRGTEYWVVGTKSYLLPADEKELNLYGLNIEDYDNLKWEDEPIEVFLNLED